MCPSFRRGFAPALRVAFVLSIVGWIATATPSGCTLWGQETASAGWPSGYPTTRPAVYYQPLQSSGDFPDTFDRVVYETSGSLAPGANPVVPVAYEDANPFEYDDSAASMEMGDTAATVPSSSLPGRSLYQQKCARCHALYRPSDYAASEWPGIVRSMKSQAALSERDIATLSAYLVAAAREAGGGYGGSGAEGASGHGPMVSGYLYTEFFRVPARSKNFDIHYLAIAVSGWVSEEIHYYGEFELEHGGTGGNNTFVEQAYIDYWFVPNVAVKVGAMLTPFNRFDEFHDPLNNFTITRPQVSREIGVSAWKDVGVDLHGYFEITPCSSFVFDYYIINGLGDGSDLRDSRQYRDNNETLSYGGRMRFILHDDYEVGFSGYRGAWDDNDLYDLRMFGVHIMAHTRWADFYGEYSNAKSENPAPFGEGDMEGFFIQASRLICSKYRPTIRFGSLDYLDPGDGVVDGRGGDKDLHELVLALAYYPTPKVVFKFEYAAFMEGARFAETENDQLGFQAAVRF